MSGIAKGSPEEARRRTGRRKRRRMRKADGAAEEKKEEKAKKMGDAFERTCACGILHGNRSQKKIAFSPRRSKTWATHLNAHVPVVFYTENVAKENCIFSPNFLTPPVRFRPRRNVWAEMCFMACRTHFVSTV